MIRHISVYGQYSPSQVFYFRSGVLRSGGIDIGHDNAGPLAGQREGRGSTNARALPVMMAT
jgi:hypothetical protein